MWTLRRWPPLRRGVTVADSICAFRYYGGKNSHLDFILPLLPADAVHIVDVFGGSGAIALNCSRSSDSRPHPHVTYNDVDARLHKFFSVLRERPDELCRAVALSPHSRRDFEEAVDFDAWALAEDEVEQARRVYVAVTQSIHSLLRPGHCNWSYSRTLYHMRTPDTNAETLYEVAKRLGSLSLENKSWDDLLERYDHDEVVFYLDPPYLPEARTAPVAYENELKREDHVRLLEALTQIKGRALLSGYDNALYNDGLPGWTRVDARPKGAGSAYGAMRTESAWLNYEPPAANLDMF